jgi:hypothetical protein
MRRPALHRCRRLSLLLSILDGDDQDLLGGTTYCLRIVAAVMGEVSASLFASFGAQRWLLAN